MQLHLKCTKEAIGSGMHAQHQARGPQIFKGPGRTLSHSKLLDGGRPASKLAGQASDETVSQLGLGCSAFRLSHSCVLVLGGLFRTHTVRVWSANMLCPWQEKAAACWRGSAGAATAAPALLMGWKRSHLVKSWVQKAGPLVQTWEAFTLAGQGRP